MGPGWSSGGFPTTVTRVKELLRFVDSPSRGFVVCLIEIE